MSLLTDLKPKAVALLAKTVTVKVALVASVVAFVLGAILF
jgi:hypothetical protein